MKQDFIWIFSEPDGHMTGCVFTTGVFTSIERAETWISEFKLTGVLTKYPIDVGSYDWALQIGLVSSKLALRAHPHFIASFSSASYEHHHYEFGVKEI